MQEIRGTTICAVKRDKMIAIAGDGQVTQGQSVVLKGNARKVRRIYNDEVIVGFAGTVSDAFTLTEKFEQMLQKYSGNLMRSAVELAQLWRSDKMVRQLEATMLVASSKTILLVDGTGNIVEPECGTIAIGSGGNYAFAAARALLNETDLSADVIARKALEIASDICIYTNKNIIVESIMDEGDNL
ncbi:MAG: ATP-dependent protease subunit HslV [Clostridia bacterium]|nr:ATP-dependent protease subunit HslV [Clostridia bacterium]